MNTIKAKQTQYFFFKKPRRHMSSSYVIFCKPLHVQAMAYSSNCMQWLIHQIVTQIEVTQEQIMQ